MIPQDLIESLRDHLASERCLLGRIFDETPNLTPAQFDELQDVFMEHHRLVKEKYPELIE